MWFGNLKKIKDNFEKIVITLDDIAIGNIDGIKNLQAWQLGAENASMVPDSFNIP